MSPLFIYQIPPKTFLLILTLISPFHSQGDRFCIEIAQVQKDLYLEAAQIHMRPRDGHTLKVRYYSTGTNLLVNH